jgi:hypothetical protein
LHNPKLKTKLKLEKNEQTNKKNKTKKRKELAAGFGVNDPKMKGEN